MKSLLMKLACCVTFAMAGVLGGYVGAAIMAKAYPVQMLERALITPDVKPGEAMLMAQHVNRTDQCDITVKRVIATATGQRISIRQDFEEGFGPLGGDKYILPIRTPDTASLGPATMYSKAYSYCSWLDYFKPSEAEAWTIAFNFADRTEFAPMPKSFERIGVKAPKPPAPTVQTAPELMGSP